MKSNAINFLASKTALAIVVFAGTLASPLAQAQQVYRLVGPDGKVTFSDRPPPAASAAAAAKGSANVSGANAAAAGNTAAAGLPFELRQVAAKYPVTLYTSDNCVPCASGRSLLTTRGVPFTEKTVSTAEDSQALKRLSGETSLPFVTIGGQQQLKGFSDAEWTQYLDAAGYPPSSVLPAGYRAPAAAPLVAVTAAPAAATPSSGAASGNAVATPPPRTVEQPVSKPSGIRF